MAWGFAQLEGCILIYSNWNGKAKVTKALTFFLGYSQAGSEQTTGMALPQVLPPHPKPNLKGEEEKGRRKYAATANLGGSLPTFIHLLLFSTGVAEKSRSQLHSGSTTQMTHVV